MSKRSAQEKIAYYQYKLRKLTQEENRQRLQALETPTPENNNYEDDYEHVDFVSENGSQPQDSLPDHALMLDNLSEIQNEPDPPYIGNVSIPAPSIKSTVTVVPAALPAQVAPATEQIEENSEVPQLDPDLLTALGEAIDDEPKFGPNIHPTLAERWQPLLRKGLPKDSKEKLFREYLVPENCALLQAPKLNAEISAAVTEVTRNRDKKIESAQQQLGIGLSALNKALSLLLSGDDKISAIKYLSDSCRLLSDLHFMETQTRTKLITPNLAKPFLNIIQDSERDDTLFGNKLPDKIKASKAIEKQGLQIKKPQSNNKNAPTPSTSTSTHHRANYQYQGNWQGPSRFPSNRGGRGGQRKSSTAGAARKVPPFQPQSRPAGQAKPRAPAQQ